MNRPPPTETYEANALQCPNPLCRERVGPKRVLLGAFVDQCGRCGTWFLARAALGVADVNGLPDEVGEKFAGDVAIGSKLTELLRELGTIRYRTRAS